MNVRYCSLSLKVWLVETLLSFQKNNKIISRLNMEKLLMQILNGADAIDDVWNAYNYHKVPDKKLVNLQTVLLMMMI